MTRHTRCAESSHLRGCGVCGQVWLARSILSNVSTNGANRSLFYRAELRLKASEERNHHTTRALGFDQVRRTRHLYQYSLNVP